MVERDAVLSDWRTEGPPGGLEIVRFLADFRSGIRPKIVAAIWEQVSERWRAFLDDSTGAQLLIPVTLGEGTIPAWAIALHAFNHTTHHRAALTSFGKHPPELEVLDDIFAAGQFADEEQV